MRKYSSLIILVSTMLFSYNSFADINFSPVVTLRSMSGFVFLNALPASRGQDEEAHFILDEVSASESLNQQNPSGIIQLREPPGRRTFLACVAVLSNAQLTRSASCDNDPGTYFTLLPVKNGTVQIQNLSTGLCLVGDHGGQGIPSTGNCIERDFIVPQSHQWFIGPAFGKARISPIVIQPEDTVGSS
ncbi:hypothetical protein Q8118_004653 [Salmonella enterica]|nr:hypothetical protein [Salmonella enterica]EKF5237338.1 hypothetical protein [Salmonella enterica]ELH9121461.1 hypothetical protein [Salmonella enterica]ELH9144701.1 hypothetical protein [Salmonella enterica]EMD8779240.1 hypothetical protein [Salmonella enterica]